jgi:hypothetical protein
MGVRERVVKPATEKFCAGFFLVSNSLDRRRRQAYPKNSLETSREDLSIGELGIGD